AVVVDAGRARRRAGASARAAGEHHELDVAQRQRRRRGTLVRTDRHAEQLLIERVRSLTIAREHREMAEPFQRHQSLLRRRLRRGTLIAERTGPAAVAWILQLHLDAIGIAGVDELRAVADADLDLHGPALVALHHAVRGQRRHHAIDAEVLEAE